ncbi:MarR family winged helix-turn-helix transcriptional regulator [Pseudonocardia spinosispora]|uniref:MarR family winged helix-turn-helix transcriptional regulator n=1 Tax=Pseudonocardia spinosispora TaxID=103441 RepID=UPI00040FA228|nr:MarR family transcriptional regulator [Pseudonocardia spinosispora]
MRRDENCADDDGRAPSRLRGTTFWLLRRAARTADRATQECLVEAGLRPYYFGVLATLEEFGPAAQVEIGRRLGVDPSDMVAALNGLEGEGLVLRERDPNDGRRNRVVLTEAGMAALLRFDGAIVDAQREFLAGLSDAEEKILLDLLLRIASPTL